MKYIFFFFTLECLNLFYLKAEEDKAKEDDDVKSQASDWSSSVFGRNPDNQPGKYTPLNFSFGTLP